MGRIYTMYTNDYVIDELSLFGPRNNLNSLSYVNQRRIGNEPVDVHGRRPVHHDQLLRRQRRRAHVRHLPGRHIAIGARLGHDHLLHLRHPRAVDLHAQHESAHQHQHTVSITSTIYRSSFLCRQYKVLAPICKPRRCICYMVPVL